MIWGVLFAPFLLLAEGVRITSRKQYDKSVRWFGALTGIVAGIGLLIIGLIFDGWLVLSSDFGLIMVQGDEARNGLGVLIIGVAVAVGLGVCVARMMYDWPVNRRLLGALGVVSLVVGIWSAARMLALNPQTLANTRVYAFDLWWPPTLCFLGVGLGEIVLITLQFRDRLFRMLVATAIVAALSALAVGQAALDDPAARDLWIGLLLISLPACIGIATGLTLRLLRRDISRVQRLVVYIVLQRSGSGARRAFKSIAGRLASARSRRVIWLVSTILLIPSGVLLLRLANNLVSAPDRLIVAIAVASLGLLLWIAWLTGSAYLLFYETLGKTIRYSWLWLGLTLLPMPSAGLLIWLASLLGDAGQIYLASVVGAIGVLAGLLWLLAALVLGLIGTTRLLRQALARRRLIRPERPPLQTKHYIRAAALLGVAFSLVGLFYSSLLTPLLALTVFVAAWIVLAESIAPGPLHSITLLARSGELFDADSPILRPIRGPDAPLPKIMRGLWGLIKSLISLSDKPIAAIVKTLAGVIVVLILVVFVSELPNAGKTVIQAFSVPGAAEEIGQAVSDRVSNDLNRLNQELQPDIVIPSAIAQSYRLSAAQSDANTVDTVLAQGSELAVSNVKIPLNLFIAPIRQPLRELLGVRLINGSLHTDRAGYTLLANSSTGETWIVHYPATQVYTRTLEVGSEELPLPAMEQPEQSYPLDLIITYSDNTTQTLQVPLVIGGWTAQLTGDSVLSATTAPTTPISVPFTLKLQSPVRLEPSENSAIAPISSTGVVTIAVAPTSAAPILSREGSLAFAITLKEDLSSASALGPNDVIASMSEELAFDIMSSSAQLASAGMTRSWPAFQAFTSGLQAWQAYQAGDYDELTKAIQYFRQATLLDPAFALAHYRLGLALQSDRQPVAAAEAFRASIAVDTDFTAGLNALAFHLYHFDTHAPEAPAAAPPLPATSSLVRTSHQNEARRLWQQVILSPESAASLPDRASAYYGLCQDALGNAIDAAQVDDAAESRRLFSLSYFYCRQALQLYGDLSEALQADPRVKRAQATVLNTLGVVLMRSQATQENEPVSPGNWDCAANTIVSGRLSEQGEIKSRIRLRSRYAHNAVRYYQEALALLPGDPDIRCNLASALLAIGDAEPLRALSADGSARLNLAEQYARFATRRETEITPFRLLPLILQIPSEPDRPSVYYRLALEEYQAAIDRDPANLAALYGYARTFWAWRVNWPQATPPDGPEPEIAHRAEEYARSAIGLATGKRIGQNEALARAALGETLLAQARPIEAIEELQKAVDLAPLHPHYDELRWDLAQAIICGAYNDEAAGRSAAYQLSQATDILQQIRQNETLQEVQLFTTQPNLLDAAKRDRVCSRNKAGPIYPIEQPPDPNGAIFALKDNQPDYAPHSVCEWLGISGTVSAKDQEPVDNFDLHVWGGGINQRIPIGESIAKTIVLTFEPRTTYDYYFAQLERNIPGQVGQVYRPASKAYSVNTFADCTRNEIVLTFVPAR